MKEIKKRIVHVFSAPQSVYYFMDGQLQFISNNGFEVHVIVPFDKVYIEEIKKRDSNIFFHNVAFKREISLFRDFICLLKLVYLLFKINPKIIHLHTPKASFLGALASKLIFKKNIIYQMHGLISSDGESAKKTLIYYIEKTTCFLVDKVYAVSNSLKDFAVSNNYCSFKKISVIGHGTINGIDFDNKFNPELIDENKNYLSSQLIENVFVIGYIGRITIDKGIDDFLKVCSKLSNSYSVLSVVVGSNETGSNIQNKIEEYKSFKKFKFIHFEEVKDPENFLKRFNVLLFPSKREGFGLVAAEANSMKIPVVAYDIPGIRDAIENNVTGKLVEFGNLEALENAIIDYICDSRLLKIHGDNGRVRVSNLFSREKLWNLILNEYKILLNLNE